MKKICIVGAGFFGISIALILSKNKNYQIDLYERKKEILSETSLKNQQRFHLGYHYPRSKKTINEIKESKKKFINFYGSKFFGDTENIYAISKKNSKINFKKYCHNLKKNGLKIKLKKYNFFSSIIENSIITNEKVLNYFKFKKYLKNKIYRTKNIKLINRAFDLKYNKKHYDKIILCTYYNNNYLLKNLKINTNDLRKKKYELIEKIVVQLPNKLKNKSVVILDGNFLNFDPFIGTSYHLLSVVKHAKIQIQNKKYPKFSDKKKIFLNQKFVNNLKLSKFNKFIKFGKKFIPILSKAKYIKSAYAVRCVEVSSNNQYRKTELQFFGKNIIAVFSGKWNNCVKVGYEIKKLLDNEK